MSDVIFEDAAIVLCDWRGHINWISRPDSALEIGELCWINLNPASQLDAKSQFAKVVALRETRTFEVVNQEGTRFRCWMWPLDSPDMAACILTKPIPTALSLLTARESECLKLLAVGIGTRDMARELDVSLSTVHSHLKRAREKLGLASVESLISFAARYCYPTHNPLVRQHA
jgi:DNA-binding CsgD family transcriptional regulator